MSRKLQNLIGTTPSTIPLVVKNYSASPILNELFTCTNVYFYTFVRSNLLYLVSHLKLQHFDRFCNSKALLVVCERNFFSLKANVLQNLNCY